MTPQVGNATRAIAADRIAFPVAQLGRHLEQVISELNFHACMPPVNASPPTLRGADALLGVMADRYSLPRRGLAPLTLCRLLPALSGRPLGALRLGGLFKMRFYID